MLAWCVRTIKQFPATTQSRRKSSHRLHRLLVMNLCNLWLELTYLRQVLKRVPLLIELLVLFLFESFLALLQVLVQSRHCSRVNLICGVDDRLKLIPDPFKATQIRFESNLVAVDSNRRLR